MEIEMDFNKRIKSLIEALEVTNLPNKEDLRNDAEDCVRSFALFFTNVVDAQIYYTTYVSTSGWNACDMYEKETAKNEAFEAAKKACVRLNEICKTVSVADIIDFDIEDSVKLTKLCGLVAGSFYFAEINRKCALATSFSILNPDTTDMDVITKAYADCVVEKFNKRFADIKLISGNAWIEWDEIYFEYTDSKGDSQHCVGTIDLSKLYEYGYISKPINDTYLLLLETYKLKGYK